MKRAWNYLSILGGAIIYAYGLNAFILAANLSEGGFTGISIILHHFSGWPIGRINLLLNLPLFFFGWHLFGRQFAIRTIVATVAVSFAIDLLPPLHTGVSNVLLNLIYGGAALGLGLGLIFRTGGTTAGSDIIARILHRYLGWAMGSALFSFDALVMIGVGIVFGVETAMYSALALFVAAQVINLVQSGLSSAQQVMIITENPEKITHQILNELDRGVTIFHAEGGYTRQQRPVLYCVVNRNEVVRLKNLVRAVDQHAFVTVSTIHEVLGEGFGEPY